MGQLAGKFRYVFFDADDTLWENESYFREAEKKFASLLSEYADEEETIGLLGEKQEENIPIFGYGSKTLLIGMLDTVSEICGRNTDDRLYFSIKKIIIELLHHEFHLIDGVVETLDALKGKYRLAVATKGDLSEQLYKYNESGLSGYFHHVEVMQNKDEENYAAMARKLDLKPSEILMVGNSIKSDIAPVIAVGGTAIHIPHTVTWAHEMMEMPVSDRIIEKKRIKDILDLLL